MIDLTTSAAFFKRSFVWIILGLLAFTFAIFIYVNRINIGRAILPQKPPPATVAFGILPKFDLSPGFKLPANVTYELQTVSGDLPVSPTSAKIFSISKSSPSFLKPQMFTEIARRLGFSDPGQVVSGVMTFIDPEDRTRTLVIDTTTGETELTSTYLNNIDILISRPESVEDAKKTAQNFFDILNLNFANYPVSKIETEYLRVDGGNLIEANSLSASNLIGVNFPMADLDGLPIKNAREGDRFVYALVWNDIVVYARLQNLMVEKNSFATYPLKGVQKAFEDLKAGKGALNQPFNGQSLVVKSVELGYLQTGNEENYLIPVYMFNVSDGLFAYAPAVDENWTQK